LVDRGEDVGALLAADNQIDSQHLLLLWGKSPSNSQAIQLPRGLSQSRENCSAAAQKNEKVMRGIGSEAFNLLAVMQQ
jgi:hypothetical protein